MNATVTSVQSAGQRDKSLLSDHETNGQTNSCHSTITDDKPPPIHESTAFNPATEHPHPHRTVYDPPLVMKSVSPRCPQAGPAAPAQLSNSAPSKSHSENPLILHGVHGEYQTQFEVLGTNFSGDLAQKVATHIPPHVPLPFPSKQHLSSVRNGAFSTLVSPMTFQQHQAHLPHNYTTNNVRGNVPNSLHPSLVAINASQPQSFQPDIPQPHIHQQNMTPLQVAQPVSIILLTLRVFQIEMLLCITAHAPKTA